MKTEATAALLALVLDGALVVDQALFALPHELLEHLLELRIRAAALSLRGWVLERLDREVDLAVLLDGDHLRLDDVGFPQMVVHVLHVVAIDLGDVDQAEPTVLEFEERAVRRDAFDGTVDDGPDLDLGDLATPFPGRASPAVFPRRPRAAGGQCAGIVPARQRGELPHERG